MKKILLLLAIVATTILGFSNTYNTIGSGNWNTSTIWYNGQIAPKIGTNNRIYISYGNNVILGQNITLGDNCKLIVKGSLTINGNLNLSRYVILDVTGTLIINGDIIGKSETNLKIYGNVDVNGGMIFGSNSSINLNNSIINIEESLIGDCNCNLSGSGVLYIQGTNNFYYGGCGSNILINSGLPIELVYFKGDLIYDDVYINWATVSEVNNHHFEIYRSGDNATWEMISIINGAGNSNILKEYSYLDKINTNTKIIYYRLNQIDYDGKSKSMKTIAIENNITKLKLFPNPCNDNFIYIENNSSYNRVEIYSINGECVLFKDIDLTNYSIEKIDVTYLKSGSYIVVYKSSQIINREILIKK